MSLNIFDINIVSLNKYIDDLHNLCSIIKLQIQVIGICEHKIKKGSCLNGLLPGCTFEFEQTTSTHGGVSFFINDNFCYKVRNDLKMLLYGWLESIFIEISFDIFGLIHRHSRMPINDFCDDYLIEYLNKIAILDNPCILMGDFKINLLKSHASSVTSKFLEVMAFCFFCSLCSVGLSVTLIGNILINPLEFVTTSGNLLCQLADHLLQFLVLKDFRVSYNSKYEQVLKRNYTCFNNNEFKNKINQIDRKTSFDSPDRNLCFEKLLNILNSVFDDHAPIKKLSKKEKSLTEKPWIDNYL